jgi:hypothetical protein
LPQHTEGNIFRLRDGIVMVTMVSAWKHLRNANSVDTGLQVTCRLSDAVDLKQVQVAAVYLGEIISIEPERTGDSLKITPPSHGKATVILLSR